MDQHHYIYIFARDLLNYMFLEVAEDWLKPV